MPTGMERGKAISRKGAKMRTLIAFLRMSAGSTTGAVTRPKSAYSAVAGTCRAGRGGGAASGQGGTRHKAQGGESGVAARACMHPKDVWEAMSMRPGASTTLHSEGCACLRLRGGQPHARWREARAQACMPGPHTP